MNEISIVIFVGAIVGFCVVFFVCKHWHLFTKESLKEELLETYQ